MICIKTLSLIFNICLFTSTVIAQNSISEKGIEYSTIDKVNAPTKTGIVIAGSSITWGGGNLCDGFSGEVVDYIMTDLSTFVMGDQMKYPQGVKKFLNSKQYKGLGMRLNNLNSKVEFDLFGDEISICQSILRTSNYGVMQVKADGKVIGRFTNRNPTIGQDQQLFIGTGVKLKFQLDHSATYSHKVEIDGRLIQGNIYTGGWSRSAPDNPGFLIIRKLDKLQRPVHYLWFKEPPEPGAKITVKYKFGKVIMFEGSTVGQTNSDEENESNYGEGGTSFDPASPAILSSGMEFRYLDKDAFWNHKFNEQKLRHFEIEIIDGVNPYFIINFASNRYHNFMNAGIGGWSLARLLDGDGIHDYPGLFQYFLPDVIVNESATNDDWAFGERKLKRLLTELKEKEVKELWALELNRVTYQEKTRDYSVSVNTGLISNIDAFSLSCPQIIGSGIVVGDIIRIGNYYGDNRQVACREIATVDLINGIVSWLEPLATDRILNVGIFDDLIGKECSVRDLSDYQKEYEYLIEKMQKIAPHTKILITQPGLSNYRMRQLWGYEIIHRRLAAKYLNVSTIEVTDWLQDFQNGNISSDSTIIIKANGNKHFTLPWKGHWQGFEVWVDNKNVYGTDCYIDGGYGYSVDQTKSGTALNIENSYDKRHIVKKNMQLVFTKNVPLEGSIRVIKADAVWSEDFCHTNKTGAYIYGQIYKSKLSQSH